MTTSLAVVSLDLPPSAPAGPAEQPTTAGASNSRSHGSNFSCFFIPQDTRPDQITIKNPADVNSCEKASL